MRFDRAMKGLRSAASDDSGMALMIVISVSVIIFLLLTTVLTLSTYHDTQSSHYTARTRAMHMADAGVNAYLYELERKGRQECLDTLPTLNSTMQDGSWNVSVTNTNPFTLTSVGTITGPKPTTRSIVATVRFPTFAEYTFLTDSGINIGAAALIDGKVRTNGSVNNDGHVTGSTTAGGSITGSGQFDGGKFPNQPKVDFAGVTADMAAILSEATASGTYFHNNSAMPSGYLPSTKGYLVTLSGTSVTIDAVNAINSSTGVMTLGGRATRTIPASGVFYFKPVGTEPIYVRGSYGAKVTLVCPNEIQIVDDFAPSDPTSKATGGLIAGGDVRVPTSYSSVPGTMLVQAAMLSQSGAIYGSSYSPLKSKITIRGAMACRDFPYFSGGWASREYVYDPRLNDDPPPMYPENRVGSLRVNTWIEQ